MKENLLFCVLLLVTYKCDGYGSRPMEILGELLSGAQDVIEEISNGGINIHGQFQGTSQQGAFYKPQVSNNYGGYKPQKPVDTIVVIVEEGPEENQYNNNGQYSNGYGYIPQNFNKPNHQNRPGHYGGNNNNRPWNNGYGQHPSHHRPGYGPQHNPHYPGNYAPNYSPNNNNFNQNQNGNNNNRPNRPFDRPFNNNNGNTNQNPYENLPTPNNLPNRPFDRPVNTGHDNIPVEPTHRPFKPFNNQGDLPGIPTSRPGQGEQQHQNKPNTDNVVQKPVETTTTEVSVHNTDKTTKSPKGDDTPLFVPLKPDQYVYGGDKIEINAPKREANGNPKPAEADYGESNIDPLDIRIGENA